LKPLPFPDADRLVRLTETHEDGVTRNATLARLLDWDRLSSTFDGITGYSLGDGSITTDGVPQKIVFASVAPRFFDVLGVAPALGRVFRADDHRLGQAAAVIYGDRAWRQFLGGDPAAVGRTVRLEDGSYTTVGVLPASFRFFDPAIATWSTVAVDAPWFLARGPNDSYRAAIGRLKPGVTLDQARADLERVQAQLAELYPDTDRGVRVLLTPLKATVVGGARASLWLVFGAVTLLLLIACTNIGALLLSRAAQREREIGVRYALGASRGAVIGQLLAEAAVLAFAGAAIGFVVASAGAAALRAAAPGLPRVDEIAVDARILLYTLGCAATATVLCGLAPALRGARGGRVLASASRGQVSARRSPQWLLVGVQVALSVTLLAGAGLLVRSLDALARVERGFDASHVLAFRTVRNSVEWTEYDRVRRRIERLVDEVGAVPGVESVAVSGWLLPGIPDENQQGQFEMVEERAPTDPPLVASGRFVSPGYFETLGIPLAGGELCRRGLGGANRTDGEAMVNRSFADRYFPGRDVVGLHVRGLGWPTLRVVGIVGDARDRGIDRSSAPAVYACDSGVTPFGWYLVRTAGPPLAAAGAVRARINAIEPLEAVYDVAPLEDKIAGAYAQERLRTALLAAFAAAAVALACLGVFGTLSYVVSLRRREVALRVALGAQHGNIVVQFLAKAMRVVTVACAVGVVLALAFGRLLSGMLYGVSPSDPATLAAVVAIVVGVAALAAFLPALRAARIDPMHALREE